RFIQDIVRFCQRDEVRLRMVFLEDYDANVARHITQGVDVWLNTPRRPMEASGTSGMKAAVNGAINLSVLDGWWCEAYNGENGWAVGSGEEFPNDDYQDEMESRAIFDLLEKSIIPLYYDRGLDGLPRAWLHRMKASMKTICPVYNTNRMVQQYAEMAYLPADAL
ncbi:alpha-glucan phosphorylase, partial [mine drainage metagenome]